MMPPLRGHALCLAAAAILHLGAAAMATSGNDIMLPYDPDVDMNTPQTIRKNGYPAEAHTVQTADGYILTMHRIPRGKEVLTPDTSAPSSSDPPSDESAPYWTTASRPTSPEGSTKPPWTTPTPSSDGPTTESFSNSPPAATPEVDTSTSWLTVNSSTTPETNLSWTTAPTTSDNTSPDWMSTEPADEMTKASVGTTPNIPPTPTTTTVTTRANATTTPTSPRNVPSTVTTTSPTTTVTPTNSTTTIHTTTFTPTNATTTTSTTTFAPTNATTTTPTTTFAPTTTTSTTTVPPQTTVPPHPTARPVIFLQHGLLGSSYDWIVAGPGKALAYLLADAGYDVWMGNARGNTYSRAHVYLPTESSSPFWDFSFHEMGVYDLPAEIDYILNITGSQQLHYVGHSMGTTMFFVMASLKPEVAAGVSSMHALAPVVFVRHIKSPIRLLAPFAHDVEFLARLLGEGEFLPQNKILHYLAKYGCELLETEKEVCENLIFILCGYDKPQFDSNILPVLLSHTPAGASTRTLIHYAQMIKSGRFQMYDFGKYMNLKQYRSLIPPAYDLSAVNVSTNLIYASNDWLASPMDVNALYQSLQCTKKKYLVPFPTFNHLDFILAKDVKKLLYDKLLKDLPRETYYQSYDDLLYD